MYEGLFVFVMDGFNISCGDFVVFMSAFLVCHWEYVAEVVSFPSLCFSEAGEVECPPTGGVCGGIVD